MRDLTRCHTSTSCTPLLIYTPFEINIKSLWQNHATSNQLEIMKIEWREVSDPIVITAYSLRQLQHGNWKVPNKPRMKELTNLPPALQELTKFPHFKNTHPLTRHLVKGLIRQGHPSVSDDHATSQIETKQNKLQLNQSYVWGEKILKILSWHFFDDTGSSSAPLIKISISL